MKGKTNYLKKEKEIQEYIKKYNSVSKERTSIVLYCFDCDEYDNDPRDETFLKETKKYCDKKGYKYIWFCKDVESVYLGHKVDDTQKKKEAEKFQAKELINTVKAESLTAKKFRKNASNILSVLDNLGDSLIRK